jgi:hypothetical protein
LLFYERSFRFDRLQKEPSWPASQRTDCVQHRNGYGDGPGNSGVIHVAVAVFAEIPDARDRLRGARARITGIEFPLIREARVEIRPALEHLAVALDQFRRRKRFFGRKFASTSVGCFQWNPRSSTALLKAASVIARIGPLEVVIVWPRPRFVECLTRHVGCPQRVCPELAYARTPVSA